MSDDSFGHKLIKGRIYQPHTDKSRIVAGYEGPDTISDKGNDSSQRIKPLQAEYFFKKLKEVAYDNCIRNPVIYLGYDGPLVEEGRKYIRGIYETPDGKTLVFAIVAAEDIIDILATLDPCYMYSC